MEQLLKYFTCPVPRIDALKKAYQSLVPPIKEKFFRDRELSCLCEMYQVLYPTANITEIPRTYRDSKKLIINREEFISSRSRSEKSYAIAAHWPNVVGIDSQGEAPLRIAKCESFIQHTLPGTTPSGGSVTHVLARVQWYDDHPRRNYLHSSITLCSTVFDSESSACFIPVSRIMCRCAISEPTELQFDYGIDNVHVVIPLLKV